MALLDDVSAMLKDAMRNKDQARLMALRNIRARFIEAQKAEGGDGNVTDEQAFAILKKMAKQHKESLEAFQKAGRDDLVAEESAQLAVVESLLPQAADEATLTVWVAEAIAASGAKAPGDVGKVMGALMKAHPDGVDGKLANQVARRLLSGA
jgi:hypothetical protein